MATRTYITSRSPGTYLFGPPQGDWDAGVSTRDNRVYQSFIFLLNDTKTDGGVVVNSQLSFGNASDAAGQKLLMVNGTIRWVTKQLVGSGTLSGTATIAMRVANPGFGATATYQVHAYITNGDTLEVKEVAINNQSGASVWDSTITWRTDTFAITGDYDDGDRIAFEIGTLTSPNPPDDAIVFMAWGTTNSSDTPLADATDGSTTQALAAWLEFSDTLTFYADAAPPANDACADAITIASIPYTSPTLDTTGSLDTNKAVWYTWTAPSDMRVFLNTWGSNYYARVTVYTGGCGGLVSVVDDIRFPWIGASQCSDFFDAVSGTQYWIEVSSHRTTTGGNALKASKNSGGSLVLNVYPYVAPATDDLFVSCLHIVCYKNGVPAVVQSDFYNTTPTGSAIDYTLRPLDDFNGGVNTSLRLYVALFGANPLVEILDLATLNVDELEIDYIDGPLNPANNSENTSTVVFDQSGNIYLGFYGNNYNVVGEIADVPTGNIRWLDATHADSQAGAPFADAANLAVAYEDGGSDFTEMSSDQDTLFYTSSGVLIKRWSLTSGQLADFATLPAATGVRPGARSVRLLPPSGDSSDGCLVAYGDKVLRLDSGGTVIQTYVPTQTELAQDLDKIEITSDFEHFWVSDQLSTNLFKFNITSGAQTDRIVTNLPAGQLCGFSIYNGYRAGDPPIEPPVDEFGTLTIAKVTSPVDPDHEFNIAVTGDITDDIVLKNDEEEIYIDLPAGTTVSVVEAFDDDWSPTYLVSNDPSNDNENVVIGAGENVTVLIVNTNGCPGCGLFVWPPGGPQFPPDKPNDDFPQPDGTIVEVKIPNPKFVTGFVVDK